MDHLRLPMYKIDVMSFIFLGLLFVEEKKEVKVFFQDLFLGEAGGEIYKGMASRSLNTT